MNETGGLEPAQAETGTLDSVRAGALDSVRIGGLDPTKVVVLGLIVLADLAVLGAIIALVVWVL